MNRTPGKQTNTSKKRLELMEKESHLKHDINQLRYKRKNMISEIKKMRKQSRELKSKRNKKNNEVKKLVEQGKQHLKKRDEFQEEIKKLKDQRGNIRKEITPKAQKISREKKERRKLNRLAGSSKKGLMEEFDASLKTLFNTELSLREEVIMVEMIMELPKRFAARDDADTVTKDIHSKWESIKDSEGKASDVTGKIMELAGKGEKEHLAAMEIFDKKNEVSAEGQEYHESYVELMKKIRPISKKIDAISKEIQERRNDIKPLQNNLKKLRITRREEQRREQLRKAKTKMENTGKIGLEDLRVLMESKALNLSNDKRKNKEKGKKKK